MLWEGPLLFSDLNVLEGPFVDYFWVRRTLDSRLDSEITVLLSSN